ncbi:MULTISPECIES: D-2-hydroxyacid dehydrogenase [unclassified Sinorhizobium]|uniref:D-2-hydroxyacid dehydrogenase n=1 Tax=unclassified Sinorhizobium TaxID=2613772 RepID=UPI0035238DE4
MSAKVLLLIPGANQFAAMLEPEFPDVEFIQRPVENATEALDALSDADAIISRGHGFDAACLERSQRLKWFHVTMTGTDHIAPVLAGHGITLTNGRGNHGVQITEMAILHMMAFYRSIPDIVHTRDQRRSDRPKIRVLANRTICIVGVGAIAEHAAKVFQALGMRVTGVSRSSRIPECFDRIYAREELKSAAAEADFLLLLVPYSVETDKLINAAVLSAMKPSAILINLARGGVVDEPALVEALRNGTIAGAGLDVYSEFPLPQSSALWDMENVFMTPWTGGQTDQGVFNAMRVIKPNLRCFLENRLKDMINRVEL